MNNERKPKRPTIWAERHATGRLRAAALSKVTAKRLARYREQRLGTFGPASKVRRIDPATGKVRP
jgi:hypothetical protein